MFEIFAHAGEVHEAPAVSFWTKLGHQPTWVSLALIAAFVVMILLIARKLTLPNRLLIMVLALLAIGIFYMQHNPKVTGITLSVGFIMTFLLTFTMLGANSIKHKK